jgi:3-oxoacyl-[acyl-carrier protein] reductase
VPAIARIGRERKAAERREFGFRANRTASRAAYSVQSPLSRADPDADRLQVPTEFSHSDVPRYPDLEGKVAVVTGSSRGIGAATCRLLAANGARVVINGRDPAAVETTVEAIRRDGGSATGVVADVSDVDALHRLRQESESVYGPVDVLGAFVGGGGPPPGPTAEITPEEWRAAIEGNLTVTFLTLRSFLPSMVERGQGSIITLASTAARLVGGERIGAPTGYAAAKAAVVRLTQEVAKEVAPQGVRVNCVSPSTILTERLEEMIPADRRSQMTAMHPLGRLGTPEDVALAVLFLASESSSWITGVTLDVAGGQIMT